VTGKLGNDAIDPMIAAQLRTNAMIELGMALGANTRFQGASSSHVTIDREAGSILDTEIVAIYW